MPRLPYAQLAIEIHEINIHLVRLLGDRSGPCSCCSDRAQNGNPDMMTALCREFRRAQELLASCSELPPGTNNTDIAAVREQVQQLRDLLPSAHKALVHARDRLGLQNKAVSDVFEWTRLSRQTF
jgi:hypothetical protein